MFDKRVVRGNTYASMVIPASTTADQMPMPKQRGKKSPSAQARVSTDFIILSLN